MTTIDGTQIYNQSPGVPAVYKSPMTPYNNFQPKTAAPAPATNPIVGGGTPAPAAPGGGAGLPTTQDILSLLNANAGKYTGGTQQGNYNNLLMSAVAMKQKSVEFAQNLGLSYAQLSQDQQKFIDDLAYKYSVQQGNALADLNNQNPQSSAYAKRLGATANNLTVAGNPSGTPQASGGAQNPNSPSGQKPGWYPPDPTGPVPQTPHWIYGPSNPYDDDAAIAMAGNNA